VFAPGDRVMFLKNDRELVIKNGSLGTVTAVSRDSMRVTLDRPQQRQVAFNFHDYCSLEYGYAATVHKAQGATVDRVFVLATPGMDRHLAYVGMTRHREDATLYAARDDFKNFEALREHLSRARPKDTTLNYARRRGLEGAVTDKQNQHDTDQKKELEHAPVARFKRAQHEFIKVAGRFDLDPGAKIRAAEFRQEMKSAAQRISRDAALMREAERAGIAGQVKSLAREKERALSKDQEIELER
jgi:hypothetical protein